jgi:uncharacterized surface protein with fasciclin (FAS1) repeats
MERTYGNLITTLLLSYFSFCCTNQDADNVAAGKNSVPITATASVNSSINISGYLSNVKEYSMFNGFVKKAGLAETLGKPGPFTIFAPTNRAFEKLPAVTVERWEKENAEMLQNLVGSHIVAGSLEMKDLRKIKFLTTIEGSKITVTVVNNNILINNRPTPVSPFTCSNGIIYSLDDVLQDLNKKAQ